MSNPLTEEYARSILLLAVSNGQAAEFIFNLWEGGTFTLDVENKRLIFLTADQIRMSVGGDD